MSRAGRGGAILATLAAAAAATGCGSHSGNAAAARRERPRARPPRAPPPARDRRRRPARRAVALASRAGAAAGARPRGDAVLAVGGLDAADSSVADVVRVAPGAPRRVGALPAAIHDVGAATLGSSLYVFGGGSTGGPTAAITRVAPGGAPGPRGAFRWPCRTRRR